MKKFVFGLLIAVALLAGSTAVRWLLLPPVARAQVNTFCASNLSCTVSAAWSFTSIQPKSMAGGGYQFADQFAGADASVKINACIAQVIANGGGKCDASGLYGAQTISQEIDVGNHAQNQVTLLLPQGATWTVSGITNGTSCALKLFSESAIIGNSPSNSSMSISAGANTNNLDSLLCTEAAPTGNGSYVRAGGFQLTNPSGRLLRMG